jgi:hypothetical protein
VRAPTSSTASRRTDLVAGDLKARHLEGLEALERDRYGVAPDPDVRDVVLPLLVRERLVGVLGPDVHRGHRRAGDDAAPLSVTVPTRPSARRAAPTRPLRRPCTPRR